MEIPAIGAGSERRHRAALRAPRQAAGDGGLARRARPVDAGARGRPTVRPGRRRRRLRRRSPASPRSRRCTPRGGSHTPLRRAHRVERGVGLTRPAVLRRGARRPDRHAEPRRLPRFRLPRLRPAVGHDVAARARRRARCGSTSSPTGCTPATCRAWCRRRSGSPACCSTGWRTRRPARSSCPSCTVEIPEDRRARRRATRPPRSGAIADHYPVRRRRRPDDRRPRRAAAGAHVAGRRSSVIGADGLPGHRPRRQRAAAEHVAQAVVPHPADVRSGGRARRRAARVLEADPPYGARVSFSDGRERPGLERSGDWRRGSAPRSNRRRPRRSASRPARSARAGRSRSWACSASGSPRPSSSSPACSAPTPTPTARTSTSTCRPRAASRWRWHTCSTHTRPRPHG